MQSVREKFALELDPQKLSVLYCSFVFDRLDKINLCLYLPNSFGEWTAAVCTGKKGHSFEDQINNYENLITQIDSELEGDSEVRWFADDEMFSNYFHRYWKGIEGQVLTCVGIAEDETLAIMLAYRDNHPIPHDEDSMFLIRKGMDCYVKQLARCVHINTRMKHSDRTNAWYDNEDEEDDFSCW